MSSYPDLCPCGSHLNYSDCCQPLHMALSHAATPEQLMRSRYSAFVLKEYAYLLRTHDPEHLDGLTREALSAEPLPQWLALEVLDSQCSEDGGQVTFRAWYKLGNNIDAIFERSSFIQRQGQWFYTQGVQMQAKLPGRNELCVCQSGKKFKHCCSK